MLPIDTKDVAVPRSGTPLTLSPNSRAKKAVDNRDGEWGANFWVTLIDPQTDTPFFACPATGEVSWDAPVGNFVLPPSTEGEWWELTDDTRGGIPYYYQTKTGETVWERPSGFVIPLGIIQNTALGRRLSKTAGSRVSMIAYDGPYGGSPVSAKDAAKAGYRRTKSYNKDLDTHFDRSVRKSQSTRTALGKSNNTLSPASALQQRRAFSNETQHQVHLHHSHSRIGTTGSYLPPIPASPAASEKSRPPSAASRKSMSTLPHGESSLSPSSRQKDSPGRPHTANGTNSPDSGSRKQVSYVKPKTPQSLNAAVEILHGSHSDSGHGSSYRTPMSPKSTSSYGSQRPSTPSASSSHLNTTPPRSTATPIPRTPDRPSTPKVNGKTISGPIMNDAATLDMSPVKKRAETRPIPVQSNVLAPSVAPSTTASLRTGAFPVLPHDLAMDIQQFSESDYAKKYFSTHRRGFLFRRTIPVAQMMTWQKTPLSSSLLALDRSLHKQAVRTFKIVQYIMGDREKDRHIGNRTDAFSQTNASSTSLASTQSTSVLEEERWLLGEGVTHPELRDEIYCQVLKQLTGNPNPESAFRGWQLICVLLITFPPSKTFETYLRSFIQQHTTKQEGRIDVMAKYCLRRLAVVSKKGPRGKAPTVTEIETASDAAFNPSTFGESLDAIYRLQERNYPRLKVPIILPFLADGILALGGTKSEGIFRVPGDGDAVSELKLRIDRGFYTLDGVDDPHVLASLMKLWLRELCDPLVPEELYNECITSSSDPGACVRIVERLPTINRRVVLFVVSFLQLFLEDKTQAVTKMTSANLALVMAPNLLRCNSESMTVVFTNARFEQIFVHNLLLHLKCNDIDADYAPQHGLGAVPATSPPRSSKSRARRNPH